MGKAKKKYCHDSRGLYREKRIGGWMGCGGFWFDFFFMLFNEAVEFSFTFRFISLPR